MDIGKLPNEVLSKIVIDNIDHKREEVLVRAGIGEDCAVIKFGNKACILSTDPITGASSNIGKLAVNISSNDVAATGGEPIGLLMTMLLPPDITEEDIEVIMKEAGEEARKLNIEIVGGHTEITDAVNKIILVVTVIGMRDIDKVVGIDKNVKAGDKILITKYAGIEGTAIISYDLEEKLIGNIDSELIKEGKNLSKYLSVVKDGIIAADNGAEYMHDITEGGVLGAVWEASKANNVGIIIEESKIPLLESTKVMSSFLDIDPLKLISSGSMVIIANPESSDKIIEELSKANIKATEIGEVLDDDRVVILKDKKEIIIDPPGSDEIYKVI